MTRETRLRRASELTLELTAGSVVELYLGDERFWGNHLTLAVLDTFATSKTIEAGLEELRLRIPGSRAWLEIVQHVTALYRWGVLRIPGQKPPRLRSHPDAFDAAPVHIRMLNDRARTGIYQQAIRETVGPGDVVVDIGTGTGVLAITAALAGARQVYAIESGRMGWLARRAFAANGLSDRISLIEGRSTHIELPEKADVLVSEIIGNDPLDEGILETTSDAVQRLLKPGARLIPNHLEIYGLPVSVPPERLKDHVFTDRAASRWQRWYGVDFSEMTAAAGRQNHALYLSTYEARDWPRFSEPIQLAALDLRRADHPEVKHRAEIRATHSGELNGVLVYFETRLSESVDFSVHPSKASPDNSWASKVWIAGEPFAVKTGDDLQLSYSYGDTGSEFEIERRVPHDE